MNTLSRQRLIYYLSMIVVILAVLCIAVWFYCCNFPYDPLIFKDEHGTETNIIRIANKDKIVHNGGYIELVFDFCKTVFADGEVEAHLVSQSSKALLVWPDERAREGCHKATLESPAPFKLPPTINFEQKYIELKITYQVNPIRTVEEVVVTEEFTVVP